jgi:hypothetical protein
MSTLGWRWVLVCRVEQAAVFTWMVLGGAAAAEEWTVKTVPRTDGSGTRCVVESTRQSLSDGYQTTTAVVTVDGRSVSVTSASNLDPGLGDIGLVVDQEPLVPMDRLAGPKTALFESTHARLVELLKAGLRLRAQLRFWPEWPATGPHAVTFSLIGFTKAYGELAGCR